jgi:hypothetical protein
MMVFVMDLRLHDRVSKQLGAAALPPELSLEFIAMLITPFVQAISYQAYHTGVLNPVENSTFGYSKIPHFGV